MYKTLRISVTHFSLLSSFESEEKNPLRDISLRQNYEILIGEMNFRLGRITYVDMSKKRVSSLPKFANFTKNLRWSTLVASFAIWELKDGR